MPSFLPKFLKYKTRKQSTKTSETEDEFNREQVLKGRKPRWGFQLPRRQTLQELIVRFKKRTSGDSTPSSKQQRNTLPPAAPKRRRRRPNMQTTQRKLAASKKRLQIQQTQSRQDTVLPTRTSSSRPVRHETEISEDLSSSPVASETKLQLVRSQSSVRRSATHPEFLITGNRGSISIEVEFIDDSDSPSNFQSLRKTKTTPENLPTSFTRSSTNTEGEIGVEWKPVDVQSSRAETRSVTPSRYYSLPSELGSSMHSSSTSSVRKAQQGKSTQSSESGSGASDVVMEALTEYRRDRVIEKLAGLKIQQPVESQCFEAKKALKIHPPVHQTCKMVAYPSDQDCKAPEWIQKWNSSFRSLSSCPNDAHTVDDETKSETPVMYRSQKSNGEIQFT